MKLFKICKEFLFSFFSKKEEIPLEIAPNETMVRCIGHDIFYSSSKNRLASTAYLPPKGSNEVSLIRLKYSNPDFCKKHAKSLQINNYNYCGLAVTQSIDFSKAIQKCSSPPLDQSGSPITVNIVATPLDIELKKRTKSKIFITDEGIPSHADLVYNFTPIKGKSSPSSLRKIAKQLTKTPPTVFYRDNNPETEIWSSSTLQIKGYS